MASLIALPCKAETISLMAIRIGSAMRQIVRRPYDHASAVPTVHHRIH